MAVKGSASAGGGSTPLMLGDNRDAPRLGKNFRADA